MICGVSSPCVAARFVRVGLGAHGIRILFVRNAIAVHVTVFAVRSSVTIDVAILRVGNAVSVDVAVAAVRDTIAIDISVLPVGDAVSIDVRILTIGSAVSVDVVVFAVGFAVAVHVGVLIIGDSIAIHVGIFAVRGAIAVDVRILTIGIAVPVDIGVFAVWHAIAVDIRILSVGNAVAIDVGILSVWNAVAVDVAVEVIGNAVAIHVALARETITATTASVHLLKRKLDKFDLRVFQGRPLVDEAVANRDHIIAGPTGFVQVGDRPEVVDQVLVNVADVEAFVGQAGSADIDAGIELAKLIGGKVHRVDDGLRRENDFLSLNERAEGEDREHRA